MLIFKSSRDISLCAGYGQTGPYAKRPGYDVMIEAEAGLMYITGEEHGPPVKVGVAVTGTIIGNCHFTPP